MSSKKQTADLSSSMPSLLIPTLLALIPTQEPETPEDFKNSHLLVSTEWVAENSSSDGVICVDVRDESDYEEGHLPGAIHLPRAATLSTEGPGSMLASAEDLVSLLGKSGISSDDHLVLYDSGFDTAAARVFWTLEVLGHSKVSVVDGGIPKWEAEGRPTSKTPTKLEAVEYPAPRALHAGRLTTKEELLECLGDEDVVLIDVRSDGEVAGGRVPGAVHVGWTKNFRSIEIDGEEITVFLEPGRLRELYAGAGVRPDIRLHMY